MPGAILGLKERVWGLGGKALGSPLSKPYISNHSCPL